MLSNHTPRLPETYTSSKTFKPIFFTDPNDDSTADQQVPEFNAGTENPFLTRTERPVKPAVVSPSPFNSPSSVMDLSSSEKFLGTDKLHELNGSTTSTTMTFSPQTKSSYITPTRKYYRTFVVLSLLSMLMFLPPVLIGGVSMSCGARTGYCIPKIEFRFIDDSPTSPLTTIRESIRVITYFAMDLGSNSPAVDFSEQDIKEIDTFSVDNVFQLNYFGYCKTNYLSDEQTCSNFQTGLDLPSVLVRDAGTSLGTISNQRNPDDVGNSLVTGFHVILDNIGDDNEVAYKAIIVKFMGLILPYVILASFICSFVALVYAVVLVSLLRSKTKFRKMQTRVSLIFNLLNLLNLGSFMLNAGDLAVEYAYVTKLAEATGNSDLAVVGLGSGFYVQVLCVALQFIICFGFATLVLAKPWTK